MISDYIYEPGEVHDHLIKWKHFPRYWSIMRGIHRSQLNSPHKGQRRGALMFYFILFNNAYPLETGAVLLQISFQFAR